MCLKFRNTKFNIFCKITFLFLYKMIKLRSSEVDKVTLEQVKKEVRLWLYAFQFFKKKTIETKLVPEIYKFLIKIYLESFEFSCLIIFTFAFSIELIVHQKNNQYQGQFYLNMPLGSLVCLAIAWHIIFYFSR